MKVSLCLKYVAGILFTICILPVNARNDSIENDLIALSVEQLHNVKIVSASKMLMKASQVPASVAVKLDFNVDLGF